jgi:alpha-tubulin suppressor-like RCC1 family protein
MDNSRYISLVVSIVALVALGLGGCTNDLNSDSLTFECGSDRPCAEGFQCSPEGICVDDELNFDTGADTEPEDVDDSDGDAIDPPDTAEDASDTTDDDDVSDTTDADDVSDATDASDTSDTQDTDDPTDTTDTTDTSDTVDDGGDTNDTCTQRVWLLDCDGDGYANPSVAARSECDPPTDTSQCPQNNPSGGWDLASNLTTTPGDCDDGDATQNPGAIETCDGEDTDCDGTVDGPNPQNGNLYYVDCDGDGDGSNATGATTAIACSPPSAPPSTCTMSGAKWSLTNDDCDDNDSLVYDGAPEVCGEDRNCNGAADDGTFEATSLFAGTEHVCAFTQNDDVYCWGRNGDAQNNVFWGQAVPSTSAYSYNRPTLQPQVSQSTTTLGISFPLLGGTGGFKHSCVIDNNRKIFCWGDDTQGQLGDGTANSTNSTVAVQSNLNFQQISGNANYNCALSSGEVHCWGQAPGGIFSTQENSPKYNSAMHPPQQAGRAYDKLAAGLGHVCGLEDPGATNPTGPIYCYGENADRQCGQFSIGDVNPAEKVGNESWYVDVYAGARHTCAVSNESSNNVYCWGSDRFGQLGNGSATMGNQATPQKVVGVTANARARFSAGSAHACALSTSSSGSTETVCWGNDSDGQLGDGAPVAGESPVNVSGNSDFVNFAIGVGFTCAIEQSSNEVYCWGNNRFGQLGDRTTTGSNVPQPVSCP